MEEKIRKIIPTILEEMQIDEENESWELLHHYRISDAKERGAMNASLLFLCGWSFETILEKCGLKLADKGVVEC